MSSWTPAENYSIEPDSDFHLIKHYSLFPILKEKDNTANAPHK